MAPFVRGCSLVAGAFTGRAADRRFVFTPSAGDAPSRRIWELDPGALFVVLGVLLERAELCTLILETEGASYAGIRDEVLLREAVERCGSENEFALAVEELLDRRTQTLRDQLVGCPMAELAGWWLQAREHPGGSGRQLATLLWSLARDGRWVIQGLVDRVTADLWVRALRLLANAPVAPGLE
jgi:hypothetical protein